MMKLRWTLAMLVLIGLAAFGAIKLLGDPPKPPSARLPLVPEELLRDWEEIDLDLLSDQDLRIVREPGAVRIKFGSDLKGNRLMYSDAVDLERLTALLQALRDSWRDPLQGSAEDLLRAGLDPPRFHLTIRRGQDAAKQEVALGFGNDDPTGQGMFARCFGDKTVFRTGPQVANLLSFPLRDWRSKSVFTIDPLVVSRIDLVKYDEAGGAPGLLSIEKQGPRTWRITQPRSLRADPQACQSLVQQATLLKIAQFISQAYTPLITGPTHLPDHPSWSLQLYADSRAQVLEVGALVKGQGYACRLLERDPDMVFALPEETLGPILNVAVDSLRPRRLWPRIETSLVGLKLLVGVGADARTLWSVEREGQHPRGNWNVKLPFQGRVNEGKGSGSFAQVVVELDRIEVEEFLPGDTPFTPEAVLALQWKAEPLLPTKTIEIARDREHGRTLARDPEQPGELFAVSSKLGALIDLDLELCRDRTIFGPSQKEFLAKLKGVRLAAPGRAPLEFERAASGAAEPKGTTQQAEVPKLQNAAAALMGVPCSGYVRAATVLAAAGAVDPFATVACELTIETYEGGEGGKETLVVSGAKEGAQAADGIYCKLTPRLPDDVWMIVPRTYLEELFRLLQ